jgi:hypothetical protein
MPEVRISLSASFSHRNRPEIYPGKKRMRIRLPVGTELENTCWVKETQESGSYKTFILKEELRREKSEVKAVLPCGEVMYFYLSCLGYPVGSPSPIENYSGKICQVCLLSEIFSRSLKISARAVTEEEASRTVSTEAIKRLGNRLGSVSCNKEIVRAKLLLRKEYILGNFRTFFHGKNTAFFKGGFSEKNRRIIHLEKTRSFFLLGGKITTVMKIKLYGTKTEVLAEIKKVSERQRLVLPYRDFYRDYGLFDLDVLKAF